MDINGSSLQKYPLFYSIFNRNHTHLFTCIFSPHVIMYGASMTILPTFRSSLLALVHLFTINAASHHVIILITSVISYHITPITSYHIISITSSCPHVWCPVVCPVEVLSAETDQRHSHWGGGEERGEERRGDDEMR